MLMLGRPGAGGARERAMPAMDSTRMDDVIQKLLERDDLRMKEHRRVKEVKDKPRDAWTVNDVDDVLMLYRTYVKPPIRG
jgi:hypothetical protein